LLIWASSAGTGDHLCLKIKPFQKKLERKPQQHGRRGQAAQRFWYSPFQKRLERKRLNV